MIKQTNPASGKAKDLTLIAVVCDERNFKDIVAAFEYADGKHKRYTLFKRVRHYSDVWGQRWDGYIKMVTSSTIEREVYIVLDELESRGVKKLTVSNTSKGPIIELPKQSQVNS